MLWKAVRNVGDGLVRPGISNKQFQQHGKVSHQEASMSACPKSSSPQMPAQSLLRRDERSHPRRNKHTDPDQIFYFTSPA